VFSARFVLRKAEGTMKSLILTSSLMSEFTKSDFADLAVNFSFRFVWGPLPSSDELATYLDACSRPRPSLVGFRRQVGSEQKQES
jgi:hypothetical protein